MQQLFENAMADLRRNWTVVLKYAVSMSALLVMFRFSVNQFTDNQLLTPLLEPVLRLILTLFLGVTASAVQAMCFSMLGRTIEGPIWKCPAWQDALKRFFLLWLIINLFIITVVDIQLRLTSAGEEDLATLLELLVLTAHLIAIPLGTAIMFWGKLVWQELPDALLPLKRFFRLTTAPLGIALMQYILINVRTSLLQDSLPVTWILYVITDMLLAALDLFIFALTWRICILDKCTPRSADEDMLDF